MPYSQKAHNYFEGIAHGNIKPKNGLTKEKASKMASEGVKDKKKSKLETMYK